MSGKMQKAKARWLILQCRKVIGFASTVADCLLQQTVLSLSKRAAVATTAVPVKGRSAIARAVLAHSMASCLSSLSAGWVAACPLH